MRNVSIAVVALTAVAVSGYAAAQWKGAEGIGWESLEHEAELAEECARQQQLEATRQAIANRIALKEALIAELIEGRRSLREVTAAFASLNENQPGYSLGIRHAHPGSTDEERTAHNVMTYVKLALTSAPPETQEKVLTRLRCEFEAWLPGVCSNDFKPI